AEWVELALEGNVKTHYDERYYMHRDGDVTEGTAFPTYWLGAEPAEIKARKKCKTLNACKN
ncbi:dipeptidyl aminopeptidase, partial [Bacillus mycoides]